MNPFLKGLRSQILNKFIGILIRVHADHSGGDPCLLQNGNCPKSGLGSRLIAVISKIYFIDIPLDQGSMSRRKRCSKRRYRAGKSCLVERDYIHIPLTQKKIGFSGCTCPVKSIQITTLIKNRRLRRIEILWLRIPHHPSAESDHPVIGVHNGKHNTVPEFIIGSMSFVKRNQSCFKKNVVCIPFRFQIPVQIVAVLVGIP